MVRGNLGKEQGKLPGKVLRLARHAAIFFEEPGKGLEWPGIVGGNVGKEQGKLPGKVRG